MSKISVDCEPYGTQEFDIPDGYRHVPVEEFAERKRACIALEDEDEDENPWIDLDRVTLYDTSTKEHMPISCAPYFWRIFVERLATDQDF